MTFLSERRRKKIAENRHIRSRKTIREAFPQESLVPRIRLPLQGPENLDENTGVGQDIGGWNSEGADN